MSHSERPGKAAKERDPIFAWVVASFAAAVNRLRGLGPTTSVEFADEVFLWDDDDEEAGLSASPVPKRPPDRSDSGSAALPEPTDPRDIDRR
jgi:hypothetical protein